MVDRRAQQNVAVAGVDRVEEGQVAAVVLASGPPAAAGGVDRVVGPRKKLEKGVLDRAFGGLIRELRG